MNLLRRSGALLLALAMVLSLSVNTAWAAGDNAPPSAIDSVVSKNNYRLFFHVEFTEGDAAWLDAITEVSAGDTVYEKVDSINRNVRYMNTIWHADSNACTLYISDEKDGVTSFTVKADGYPDAVIDLGNGTYDSGRGVTTYDAPSIREAAGADDSDSDASAIPTAIDSVVSKNNYRLFFHVEFTEGDAAWLDAITEVSAGDTVYEKVDSINRNVRYMNTIWHADSNAHTLYISDEKDGVTTFTVKADGYPDVVIDLGTGTYDSSRGVTNYNNPTITPVTTPDPQPEDPTSEKQSIYLNDVTLSSDGRCWVLTFPESYVADITSVSVNGKAWESTNYVNVGGKYEADATNNTLKFAGTQWLADGPAILKSGDIITIESGTYETLTLKFVIDPQGNATISEDDGQGDPYKLYVKLVGSFNSAIEGEKYGGVDAVSGSTVGGGSAASLKNSDVTVYTALVKGDRPADDSDVWTELDRKTLQLDPSKTQVTIASSDNADSGLEWENNLTMSSDLSLSGTAKDPGEYKITMTLVDMQGRTGVSNAIPFKIYSQDVALEEQLVIDKLTPTVWDGKHMWQYQEPWRITKFVTDETENQKVSFTVPKVLKAWMGSGEGGPYADLGYDIPWVDVVADNIPQTLIIPEGCDLTMTNMKIHSSVKIVVKNGGKLTLRNSSVQGIIDVMDGGTFSMNYNGFGDQGEFTTGASINGQLHLQDGAIVENAAIYSHTNYLTNGVYDDRNVTAPVVVATGDVTVKGQVFIKGDEAGAQNGQVGLLVQDGTVHLEKDAVLAVYGGDAKVTLYNNGGSALELNNGNITGDGKLIAIGGAPFWGNGGNAASGNGTIDTKEAFLQGATAVSDGPNGEKAPGKAVSGDVKVTSSKQGIADGESITVSESLNYESGDPLADLYWNAGIDATPTEKQLNSYATEEVKADDNQTNGSTDAGNTSGNNGSTGGSSSGSGSSSSGRSSGGRSNAGGGSTTIPDTNTPKSDTPAAVPAVLNGSDRIAYLTGYSDGTVRPDATITRAEVATILTRLLKDDVRQANRTTENPFSDVAKDAWYNEAVSTMYKLGILTGRSSDTFAPNATITRAELATVCARLDASDIQGKAIFSDLTGHWAKEPVEKAAALGWVSGYADGTFRPDASVTRAETVTILNRVLGRQSDQTSTAKTWPDNPSSAWYYQAVQEATNGRTPS